MKIKLSAFLALVATVLLLGSCRSPEKCAAYSDVQQEEAK